MNTVNPQITDAVTQTNTKALGEAPAMAMGAIYQNLAHATGILFDNAVAAQQQLGIMAQAATNQGIMQIYSIDTTAGALAISKIAQSDTPDTMLSLLAALRATNHQAAAATDTAAAETAAMDTASQTSSARSQIEHTIASVDAELFAHMKPFLAALHAAVAEMVAAIDAVNHASQQNMMRTLQNAAVAACIAAMLKSPEKAKEYGEILEAIKGLA